MKHKLFYLLMTFVFAVFCANIAETEHTLSRLEEGVLRLHILANSDTDADQTVKYAVRDALLARSSEWFADAPTRAQALENLEAHLPQMEAIAQETLSALGLSDAVSASICQTDFPARTYETVTLPAGSYTALRIEIGEAAGKNWWCVMYPSLCVPAAGCKTDNQARMAEHFDSAVCDMTAAPEHYAIRLKCVEIWRGFKNWVQSRFFKS